MNVIDHYREMMRYERWANARVLESLESIPAENREGRVYDRAMSLLPHNCLARKVWLWRIHGTGYENPSDWFPVTGFDAQRRQCEEADRAWEKFIDSLDDAALDREIRYTASSGEKFSNSLRDVLVHVFNHSTYHRGQIARLVTECGGQRMATDYIAMNRVAL